MFFNDEDVFGQRIYKGKKNRKKKSVLRAKVKRSGLNPADSQRILLSILVVGAFVAVLAILWTGVALAKEAVFSNNDRFIVKNIEVDVKGSNVIDDGLVREYTQISRGTNIFSFDIKQSRNNLLSVPNVKSVDIIRQLPDTVKMSVVERIPLARIGRAGAVGADVDGVTFVLRRSLSKLPVIIGYKPADPAPGSRITGIGLAALVVLDVCRELNPEFLVTSIDVSRPRYLRVRVMGDTRTVELPWSGGEKVPLEYRNKMKRKLSDTIITWQSSRGKRYLSLDATSQNPAYPDQIIGKRR